MNAESILKEMSFSTSPCQKYNGDMMDTRVVSKNEMRNAILLIATELKESNELKRRALRLKYGEDWKERSE